MPANQPAETPTAASLNEQFGIPHTLRFEADDHGLIRAVVTADPAAGVLYLHGAHLTEYQPTGQKPVLFTSRHSAFKPGQPIRGGIPICFPWFGPHPDRPDAPPHGLARIQPWRITSATQHDDQRLQLTLTHRIDPFDLTYDVTFGQALDLRLRVHNTGPDNARFEQALHTYFAVGQVRNVHITGLEGMTYLDKTRQFNRTQQGSEPVRFDGETDRIYINHPAACTLHDPTFSRRITIEKVNANSTIVWNPWIDKAAALPDLGDDDWPNFVCIESGNVADNAITLAPTESHEMTATLRVTPA